MQQIIVSGGGGFTRKSSRYALERYVISQAGKEDPRVCFLPQASNENSDYIVKFYEAFSHLGAQPSWISLFGRVDSSWQEKIAQADIIYVGGGNTKSMIALWKAWGIDQALKAAYDRGTVMTGVSAGMLCWFDQGITDSVWPLGVVEGLGFLQGSACPHFDSEVERQEVYHHNVKNNIIAPGLALEDDTAAHFIDGKLHKVITYQPGKKAFYITHEGAQSLPVEIFD